MAADPELEACKNRIRAFFNSMRESGEFDDETIEKAIEEVATEEVGRGFSDVDSPSEEDQDDNDGG